MNPKSLDQGLLFGRFDQVSHEWFDGVLATTFRLASRTYDTCQDSQWIVMDGPVDALWIENMNTVLDDNKILTLANAERIPMLDTTKMTFEVENLRNASPATVSRNGIVFVSPTDLYWEPLFHTWIADRAQRNSSQPPCSPDEDKWIQLEHYA